MTLPRVASWSKLLARSPGYPYKDLKTKGNKWQSSQPEWWNTDMSQCHEWYDTMSMAFSSLKMGKLTFTLKSLPVCPDWPLSWETLIWFEWCGLHSLCLSKLLSAAYASFGFSFSPVSECSINQLHGPYHHFIFAPHQRLCPSLASTLQCHRPQLESWGALPSPVVTLALWPFLPSHSLNDGAATFLHAPLQQKQSLLSCLTPCHPFPHPVMMEREKCLSKSLHPLCLQSDVSPWYGRSITYVIFICTNSLDPQSPW